MIKAVIFDLDGVIVDSMHLHHEAEVETLKKHGISVTREELDRYTGESVSFKLADLLRKYNVKAKLEDVMKEHMTNGYDYIKANIKPVKGALESIQKAEKDHMLLGLASGSPMAFIKHALNKLNILHLFKSVISADDVTHGKPDPEIFLKSARMLGVNPSECLVIEDSTQGVEAAKRAGMKCIGYRNPNSGKQDLSKSDMILDDLEEVPEAIKKVEGARR